MLRLREEAEQELAMFVDGPEQEAIPAVGAGDGRCDGSAAFLSARIDNLIRRYRGEEQIDFAWASLAEVIGWCGARRE